MLDINDMYECDVVSECCGESVYINGICSYCKDLCTAIPMYYTDETNDEEVNDDTK